jgi:hypothetical protein
LDVWADNRHVDVVGRRRNRLDRDLPINLDTPIKPVIGRIDDRKASKIIAAGKRTKNFFSQILDESS